MKLVDRIVSNLAEDLQNAKSQVHGSLCELTLVFARRHMKGLTTVAVLAMARLLSIQASRGIAQGGHDVEAYDIRLEAVAHAIQHLEHRADIQHGLAEATQVLSSSFKALVRASMFGAAQGQLADQIEQLRSALQGGAQFLNDAGALLNTLEDLDWDHRHDRLRAAAGAALVELTALWKEHFVRVHEKYTEFSSLIDYAHTLRNNGLALRSRRCRIAVEFFIIRLVYCLLRADNWVYSGMGGTLVHCAQTFFEEGRVLEASEALGQWMPLWERVRLGTMPYPVTMAYQACGHLYVYACILRDLGDVKESCSALGRIVTFRSPKEGGFFHKLAHRREEWIVAELYVERLRGAGRITELHDAVSRLQLPGTGEWWHWLHFNRVSHEDRVLDAVTECMIRFPID